MKLLILLSILAYTSAATLIGSNKCTWGPSYWCSHVKHAKECGAFEHCMTTTWKNQKVENVKDTKCELCSFAVTEAESYLRKNASRAQVKNALNKICHMCPDKSVQTECQKVVNEYYDELIKMITEVDPKVVCAQLGLCSNALKDTVPHHPVKDVKKVKDDYCTTCVTSVDEIKLLIKSQAVQSEIKEAFDKICMACPDKTVQTDCTAIVNQYLPQLIDLVEKVDAKTICSYLGLCKSAVHKKLEVYKQKVDYCQSCQDGVNKVKQALKDKKTQAEVASLLNQICMSCPDTKVQTTCKAYVKEYLGEVITLIESVDAKTVCAELGLCVNVKSNTLKFKKTTATLPCEICGTVMIYAKTLVENKATQEEIENYLKSKLCPKLGTLNHQCQAAITDFGPMIFKLLDSDLNPNEICHAIGFCTTEGDIIRKSILKRGQNMQLTPVLAVEPVKPKKEVHNVKASTQCVLCEFVIRELDGMLTKNASEQQIKAALEKVCSLLPKTISAECTSFVDEYADLVVKLLAQELNPAQVCTVIGLCAGTSKPSSVETCTLCKTVLMYVDSLLKEQSTTTTAEKVLDKVCNFLGDSLKSECEALVKQYTPTILQLLAQEMNPTQICQEIKLCTSTSKVDGLVHMTKASKSNPCSYGPAYWCYSLQNAKKCNAVDHCNKHVWTNELA